LDNGSEGGSGGAQKRKDLGKEKYDKCRKQVFGDSNTINDTQTPVPSYEAIFDILGAAAVVGVNNVVDFAATIGLESGYNLTPDNHLNNDGSLDVGPAQLNVQEDHGPLDAKTYGTSLDAGDTFDGDPFDNIIQGARVFKSKRKAEYYVGQESRRFTPRTNKKIRQAQASRRSALNELTGALKKFIDCLLH
jgi:hypothetical protein